MKCARLIVWEERRRKGAGTPYRAVVRTFDPNDPIPPAFQGRMETCDGKIVATVDAVDEPDWGGTYAHLSIEYKCDTCGATSFLGLPFDADSLSAFVTEAIADRAVPPGGAREGQ